MASAEFIQGRLDGAKAKLEKRLGTIAKKEKLVDKKKAQLVKLGVNNIDELLSDNFLIRSYETDPNWNDIYGLYSDIVWNLDDIRRANRDCEDYRASIEKYEKELQSTIEKDNSRNIPVIIEFLNQWEARCYEWFMNEKDRYYEAKDKFYGEGMGKKASDWNYTERWNVMKTMDRDEFFKLDKEKRKEFRRAENEFSQTWNHVTVYLNKAKSYEENVKHDLAEEKKRKYDFIIERTNAIVGQITDASGLTIGAKGDLNGVIVGTRGNAHVQTIGAGGYNDNIILDSGRRGQCFHYRTLINPIK